MYRDILAAAVAGLGADAGSIQVLDQERGGLHLVASRGFAPASAAFWQFVSTASGSVCGMALAARERVVVADVEATAAFVGSEELREYRRSGLRGVQSTPLVAHDGRLLGMVSTLWRMPHETSAEELHLVGALSRLADPEHLPRHCAWCARLEVDGDFHPLDQLRGAGLPLLHERATHTICPDCLARELPARAATRVA